MTNENYYAAQKAARAIGTNSIDNAARVCHSPSTFGLKEALGVAAPTCSYADWIGTDLIVFIGSNVANNQPVTTKYLHLAKKAGTKVDGSVVIAAITSCTNTSNPSVMLAAGLLAKRATERGLRTKSWVKTSLAPGSKVVTDYLIEAGVMRALEQLGFYLVGYGCTTCIGNSGPLPPIISRQIEESGLVVAAVLSGNRNFEGRVQSEVRANYLASPPLVVAYAIAGRIDINLHTEPLGKDAKGQHVYLRDIWPMQEEIQSAIDKSVHSEMFVKQYAEVFKGDDRWNSLPIPEGDLYQWDPQSTYVKHPPYFENMSPTPSPVRDINGAESWPCLAIASPRITSRRRDRSS